MFTPIFTSRIPGQFDFLIRYHRADRTLLVGCFHTSGTFFESLFLSGARIE